MAVANRTGGTINVTVLGKNLKTKAVDIYQIGITTGEPVSFPTDPLSSGNYAYQTVRGKDGSIMGQVQLDEEDPSGEISFSVYEDFDFLGNEYLLRNSKNRLLNILNGEAFINNTGETIVPIGTNGTDKTKTAKAKYHEMNKPYKMVYHNEGGFIKENGTADPVTGEVALRKNPYAASFNMAHKTVCMEFQTTTGQGQVTRMFPILAKTNAEWVEGDINQFNFTAQRGCDMIEKDEFFTEIYPSEPLGSPAKKPLHEVYVDYIVEKGATKPESIREAQAVNTQKIAVINPDDGTVEFQKTSNQGSSWQKDTNYDKVLQAGTRIKSTNLITKTTPAANTLYHVNTFAVVGENGKNLVDFSTDASKRYYCTVKDYNKDTAKFEDYVTE